MFITHQNVSTLPCFLYHEWKEGLGIFLWKDESFMAPPFFQNWFSQNRLAHLHTNFELDRTDRFQEKWLFRWKLTILKNVYRVNYLDIGGYQRSTDVTNRFGTLFTAKRCYCYGSCFSFLEVWSNFSWKINKKWVLKNVHFLVNYATFENYAYGNCKWSCKVFQCSVFEYVHYPPKCFYFTLFSLPWVEVGSWIFLWKDKSFMAPPLFQNWFSQNRLAHLHTNFELDRTDRFQEKWLFC